MPLNGLVMPRRADRFAIGRHGFLRERSSNMGGITIENLSVTGCAFQADFPLEVGATISIGIPGIGSHGARVTRSSGEKYGCSFFVPIGEHEIAQAMAVESLRETAYPRIRNMIRLEEERRLGESTDGSALRRLLRAVRDRLRHLR